MEKLDFGSSPVCRNQVEVGKFLGVDPKRVPELKRDHGLPVFKIDGKGKWMGVKVKLFDWLMEKAEQWEKLSK
jgi:hypothetical protein